MMHTPQWMHTCQGREAGCRQAVFPSAVLLTLVLLSCLPLGFVMAAGESPTPVRLGPETQISPGKDYANFSTYGTTPENPGRTRMAFTRFPVTPTTAEKIYSAEIWTCDLDGKNAVKFTDVKNIDPHNGARFDWIDDETLVYFDDLHTKVRKLDGTLLYDKEGYPGEAMFGDWVLVFHPDLTTPDEGLYALNVKTGEYRALLKSAELLALQKGRLTHPRFSPDGKRIGFEVEEHFYSIDFEKGGPPLHLGPKPMHWLWYDPETIVGHTSAWGPGTRYSLDGKTKTVVKGWGNHLGIAPGGKLFASETTYDSNPVVLKLFRFGEMEGTTVFSSPFADVIWKTTKAHVNPSFARDASRIYYTKSTGEDLIQAFTREILK